MTSLVGTGLSTVALALLAHDLAGGDAGAVLGRLLALMAKFPDQRPASAEATAAELHRLAGMLAG